MKIQKPAKRATDLLTYRSVARFAGFSSNLFPHPSAQALGYCRPSASRTRTKRSRLTDIGIGDRPAPALSSWLSLLRPFSLASQFFRTVRSHSQLLQL